MERGYSPAPFPCSFLIKLRLLPRRDRTLRSALRARSLLRLARPRKPFAMQFVAMNGLRHDSLSRRVGSARRIIIIGDRYYTTYEETARGDCRRIQRYDFISSRCSRTQRGIIYIYYYRSRERAHGTCLPDALHVDVLRRGSLNPP